MATDTKLEMGFLEKLGEKFTSLGDGVSKLLTRVMGSSNERFIRKLGFIGSKDPNKPHTIIAGSAIAKINALEEKTKALSDDELKGLTDKFRERLKAGESMNDILPEAFAACREAGRRAKNMRHYDVQLVGGITLHENNISEMVTGEGKTLVATLAAYLNCISKEGVHVITVNDYLARRDCEWMLPIYQALGVSAGYIQSDMDPSARRVAYECDITYGTASEFGFDYLRDNMKQARWDDTRYHPYYRQVQRKLNYAIIDEVDNILIDEARTPLIISGPAFSDVKRYEDADKIARQLSDMETKARAELAAAGTPIDAPLKPGEKREMGVYFEVKEKEKSVHLTDAGIREAERLAGVESFYTAGNMEWPHLIDNSLKAHHLYQRDRDYLVIPDPEKGEMSIIIVDTHTGRALFGRQWSDGLHQAVESKHKKEGVQVKQENQTLATITLQNYFRMYKKLGGMTGTAMTEADEFWKIYKLDVIAIPTNKVMLRVNYPDLIYRTDREKWEAILKEVEEVHATGRPILIGTTDVAKSEKMALMLKRRGIKFELLNAKPENVAREADIVAQAGRHGAVTIATNMAGRGTDIILGGNPETMAWAMLKDKYPSRLEVPEDVWKNLTDEIERKEKTKENGRQIAGAGGLHIVGTERHDSRRIDNQLRGRAGRQGDPGSSKFYLSLQDDLMRLFAGEWVGNVLTRLGMQEGEAIESKMVSRRIQAAQKKVEEYHFESRKNLLEYDEVMDYQRKKIYGKRQEVLGDANCKAEILRMISEQVTTAVDKFLDESYGAESFREFAGNRLGLEFDEGEFRKMGYEEAEAYAHEKATNNISTILQEGLDENLSVEDDPKDWKWQEMTRLVNSRFGLKLKESDLKRAGREALSELIHNDATRALNAIDLADGRKFLDRSWGVASLCDWVNNKFRLDLTPADFDGKSGDAATDLIHSKINAMYREKEVAFPVQVAMASFMAEKQVAPGQQKYDRDGLYNWARIRFPQHAASLNEEAFRTESRTTLYEIIRKLSEEAFPKTPQEAIDKQIDEALSGTAKAEQADAQELADWMMATYQVPVDVAKITGTTADQVRNTLWNAFDDLYRAEMHQMERKLVLRVLDSSWKSHLLTMDHLRSVVGLRGYAQEDPKTVYKKEGMSEFGQMWNHLNDRVTEMVFRMEEDPEEDITDLTWVGAVASQARTVSTAQQARTAPDPLANTSTNASSTPVKAEPIRRSMDKVGRNDPCPCGSGKKYKNCHMKLNQPI
ncbi:preprotein translocase subunit SecA [Zavarzinella formosa]|uniref:preprotein translocase subunit SecA n=1 Tax=Zavarzinella formosa TaxID=360055 RepID=UPI00031610FF|nr:preprotein translocase subunit SecA [Zavarzinella formosa]